MLFELSNQIQSEYSTEISQGLARLRVMLQFSIQQGEIFPCQFYLYEARGLTQVFFPKIDHAKSSTLFHSLFPPKDCGR